MVYRLPLGAQPTVMLVELAFEVGDPQFESVNRFIEPTDGFVKASLDP